MNRPVKFFQLLAVVCIIASTPAIAQTYPSKPITVITPYGVGGQADQAARLLAIMVEKELGQPLVVVNRPGAGGIPGTQVVLGAPKDGHTLLLARVGSQAIAPALDAAVPYRWDEFTFLGRLEVDPLVCYVNSKSAYMTFAELMAAARAKPGKLTFASTGVDASLIIPVMALRNTGLAADAALNVPYKGGGEVATAVLSEQVDFTCSSIAGSLGAIRSGQLRALLVSSPMRVPVLPDIPTAREIGMANIEMASGWSALYGPPGLPQEVVDRWATILAKVKDNDAWAARVRGRGSLPSILSPSETKDFARAQFTAYRALARDLDVKK